MLLVDLLSTGDVTNLIGSTLKVKVSLQSGKSVGHNSTLLATSRETISCCCSFFARSAVEAPSHQVKSAKNALARANTKV